MRVRGEGEGEGWEQGRGEGSGQVPACNADRGGAARATVHQPALHVSRPAPAEEEAGGEGVAAAGRVLDRPLLRPRRARDRAERRPRYARDTPEIHPRYTRDTPELKGRPSPRWPRAWFGWNHHCCSVAATAPSGPSVTTTSGAPRACKRRTASEISYLHSLPLLSHNLPQSPPPRSRTYTHNSPPPPPPRPFPTGAPPAPLAHHVARRPAMATPAMEAASRWLQSSTSVCGSSSRSPPSQAPAVSEMSRSEPSRAEVSRDQTSSRGPPFLPPRISHNLPRISHNLPTRLSRPSEAQSRRSHRAPPWLAPSAEGTCREGSKR